MSSPPTVVHESSQTISSARSIASAETSPYFKLCAGGNFVSDGTGNRRSAAHLFPETVPGRKYFRTMLGFDGTTISFYGDSAPGHYYRVGVRELGETQWRYVSTTATAGAGGGALRYTKLTFGSAAPRLISFEQVGGDLREILFGPYDTIWKVEPRGPRCFIVGDSFVQSAGAPSTGYTAIDSMTTSFADTLGWDDVWPCGLGGTGYIAAASTDNFQTRATSLVDYAPDVVVVYGGYNDFASGASAIGAAAGNVMSTFRAACPDALLVQVGPNFPGAPTNGTRDTTWDDIEDAIFAATASTADIQIDTTSSGYFTGTGKAGAAATGNGTNYIQSDGVHPSTSGAIYLGQRIAHALHAALTAYN